MGEAIKFGRGKVLLYKPDFADNSWSKIIMACQKGDIPETWKVGDQKAMTIGGTDYLIDIIGINHDEYADGSGKAPLTFQMHDCYNTKYGMAPAYATNTEYWSKSAMRNTYLPSIHSLMPEEVRGAIKAVNKPTMQGMLVVDTADTLFLLSTYELAGSVGDAYAPEGSQYAYYAGGGSKKKKFNGSSSAWWLRSTRFGYMNYFCMAMASGALGNTDEDQKLGVAPAFCF